jgi:hypothetical protein
VQNAAILEVSGFGLGVDSDLDLELLASAGGHIEWLADLELAAVGGNVEGLLSGEAERLSVLPGEELKREDTHANEVGSVDALVRLSNDCLDTLEVRTLGSPVS